MLTRVSKNKLAGIVAAMVVLPGASYAADIRVMCYQDGIECDATADIAKRFEAQNPGTR